MLGLDLGNGAGRNCATTFGGIMIKSWKSLGPFVVATACIWTGMFGCGGGGSSTPITEDQFCASKAEKECVVTARCGTATPDACKMQRKAVCTAVANASKTAPRVFHPENVNSCLNTTNTVYTKASAITPAELADMDDKCAYVFQGNAPATGNCAVKYDCMSMSNICDKGICANKVNKNKGDLCANPGEVCNIGAYCAQDPAHNNLFYCLAKAAQGMPCSAAVPCVENLRCDGVTNSCQPRANATESCTTNDDCVSGASYCDPYIGNKCDTGLSFAGGAAACAAYGGSSSGVGGSGGGGTGGASGNGDASAGG